MDVVENQLKLKTPLHTRTSQRTRFIQRFDLNKIINNLLVPVGHKNERGVIQPPGSTA